MLQARLRKASPQVGTEVWLDGARRTFAHCNNTVAKYNPSSLTLIGVAGLVLAAASAAIKPE